MARKNLPPGPGRPKGVPNKVTAAVKDMVIAALEGVGGIEYLKEQATKNPVAFMSLVGRIIPTQIAGDPENPLKVIERIERVIVGTEPHEQDENRPTAH